MFSRSPRSFLLGVILVVFGGVQLFLAWRYAEAAKSEASAVGTIIYITGGRSTTYNYSFEIHGVRLIQDSGVCRTALTPQGCSVGASVLVYYAHAPALITRLEEFGAASREKLLYGCVAALIGLVLLVVSFILKSTNKDSIGSDNSVDKNPDLNSACPDVIHIVPPE
jgi:hypothetical protein